MNRTPKFCTSCGTAIKVGSVFCTGCGKRVAAANVNVQTGPQGVASQSVQGGQVVGAGQGGAQVSPAARVTGPSATRPLAEQGAQPAPDAMGTTPLQDVQLAGATLPGGNISSNQVGQPAQLKRNPTTVASNELARAEEILLNNVAMPDYKQAMASLQQVANPGAKASLLLSLAHLYESIDQLQQALKQVEGSSAHHSGAINSFGGTGKLGGVSMPTGTNGVPGTVGHAAANTGATGTGSNWGQAAVAGVVGGVTSGVVRDMLRDDNSAPLASLEDTLDEATAELSAMADNASETLDGLVATPFEALNDMAVAADDIVADVGLEVNDLVDDLADVSDGAFEALDDLAEESLDGDLVSDASDAVSDAGDALGAFFSDLFS